MNASATNRVFLVGLGGAGAAGLTIEADNALKKAQLLIGARRLLDALPYCMEQRVCEYRPQEILSIITASPEKIICVVYSGDTGFYSGAAKLIGLLKQEQIPFRVIPGLSSVSLFAARLGLPWQDWHLCSAHGTDIDPVREILQGRDTFFLTGGKMTPAVICDALTQAGMGHLQAVVGEDLTYPSEQIRKGVISEFVLETFSPLSVLLVRRGCPDPEVLYTDLTADEAAQAANTEQINRGSSGQLKDSRLMISAFDNGNRQLKHGKLMISALSSGSGKTVLTCALLAALAKKGISCESFKCGPDYLDPMFHEQVLGIPAGNLDLFLQGFDGVHRTLSSQKASLALLEGAMGFYDGVAGTTDASAWEIAATQQLPVVLAVHPSGTSVTLAAQIRGMMAFRDPSQIRGLILTMCSRTLYEHLRPVLERETGLKVLGYLPVMEELKLESRHLGLVTAGEIPDLKSRFDAAAVQILRTVDLEAFCSLAEDAPESSTALHSCAANAASDITALKQTAALPPATIAVARDEAFCFYYRDSLQALEDAGARLIFFSPLHDPVLPPCGGLYLGGGYPELYAAQLAGNVSMKESIRKAILSGLPTVAECGGFLYLQQSLTDNAGAKYEMAGVFPGEGLRTDHLVRFGYAVLKPDRDSLLFRPGEVIPVHEFHYWDCTENGSDLPVQKPDGRTWRCGFASPTLYAAFPHLHLGGTLPLAKRFADAARKERPS